MDAGADPQAEVEQLVAHVEGAADRPRGAVEDRGDAALAGLDLAAVISRERFPHHRVVAVDELVPAPVAEPDGMRPACATSVHRTVASIVSGAGAVRTPVRNSWISPRTSSASPKYGQWSMESSSRYFAPGMCSAK